MWAALYHISQGVCHSSRLICSSMTSSATSRLRLDFHQIKFDFKKSEVVQPLLHTVVDNEIDNVQTDIVCLDNERS